MSFIFISHDNIWKIDVTSLLARWDDKHKPSDDQTLQKMTRQNQKRAHACFSFPIFDPRYFTSRRKDGNKWREETRDEDDWSNQFDWLAVTKQIHNRNNEPSHELHCSVCVWINSTKLLEFLHTNDLQTLYLQIMISEWREVKAAVNQ